MDDIHTSSPADTEIDERLSCQACGISLPTAWIDQDEMRREPCPACGSKARHIELNISEQGPTARDLIKGQVKDSTRRSDEKLRVRFISGEVQSRDGSGWVRKDWLMDRNNDRYVEKVVDSASGQIIRDVDERLSDHQGHGSAKFKKD